MRYIILEDEQLAAKRLRELIQELRPDYSYVAKFDTVETASIGLPSLKFDLIFMDIQLGDGNSFELLELIKLDVPIIFTTAYDQYAIKAFKTTSIDYLLKPIDPSDLKVAIEKFEKTQKQPEQPRFEGLDILLKSLRPQGKERFVVKIGDKLKSIETSEVQLVFSQDKGTYLFTFSGQKWPVDYSLDQVEEMLDTNLFFRISRKYLVNSNAVKDMVAFTNSRLEIKIAGFNGEQVIVAREKVGDFKSWLDR